MYIPIATNKRRMQEIILSTGLSNFFKNANPIDAKAPKLQKKVFSNSAQEIVYNASLIGLDVFYISLTVGDGNCFYRSVVEQLRDRTDIGLSLLSRRFSDHFYLRQAVVEFVQNNHDWQYLTLYKTYFENKTIIEPGSEGLTWAQFLERQKCNSVYACECFIKATAVLIQIEIRVTAENNTAEGPYNIITKHMEENTRRSPDARYLLLGSINRNHFQSLIPNHGGSLRIKVFKIRQL